MNWLRLDSVDEKNWTAAPIRPGRLLVGWADRAELDGRPIGGPLAGIDWLDRERRQSGCDWIGYFAYELGYLLEPAAAARTPALDGPLYVWAECGDNAADAKRVDTTSPTSAQTFTRDEYLCAVERCLSYIAAGDIFQVNLSQPLHVDAAPPPEQIYRRLLESMPARYGGLLDFRESLGFAIISHSPELFLELSANGRIRTKPIKGTRPRLPGMEEELQNSTKDAAELNMIVDLERNDLGRVCEIGSVKVTQPRTIETHPTVLHGVATVEGQLRNDVGLRELLAATFPGGSITGAPKIRAMQIIQELEIAPRGVYCGALGKLRPDGSLLLNIAIRTATWRAGRLSFGVGGGIVADSVPAEEYEETLVKARALLSASGQTDACNSAALSP